MRKSTLLGVTLLMLLAAACVAPPPPAAQPPSQPPTAVRPMETVPAPPLEDEPPTLSGPAAITAAAVEFAAAELGVDPASIEVISVDAVDWNNSCLGAAAPNEMCLEVITPGYRVLLDVGGKQVAVHTNRDGSYMRLADPAQGAPNVKPVSYPWDPAEIYARVAR